MSEPSNSADQATAQTEVCACPIGQRIQVIGMSSSGKSTLAAKLSEQWALPLVELDALNWQPDWVGLHSSDPEKFEQVIAKATSGDRWVVDGSYERFCQKVCWDRVETIVWLDLPRRILVRRMLCRSWRRSRDKELLWGTNYERFFPHLKIWNRDESLLRWIWAQHKPKREKLAVAMSDSQWSHIRFIRLTSVEEVEVFFRSVS